MTNFEIKERLLNDTEFLVQELDKIALYYQLKHTPRWNHPRAQDEIESVAEHIYGMHILASYFMPLLDEQLDTETVRQLITWHDMAEAVVGDMTSRTKTDEHRKAEKDAEAKLLEIAPEHLLPKLQVTFNMFDSRTTPEATFVKAIDKIEPLFHMYFLTKQPGAVSQKFDLGWPSKIYQQYRQPYVSTIPLLLHFDSVLMELTKEFHPE